MTYLAVGSVSDVIAMVNSDIRTAESMILNVGFEQVCARVCVCVCRRDTSAKSDEFRATHFALTLTAIYGVVRVTGVRARANTGAHLHAYRGV